MKVAVTGAAGYLGSQIGEKLLDQLPAEDVILITRRPEEVPAALRERGAEVRRGDYADPDSLAAAFAGADRAMIMTVTFEDTGRRVELHRAAIEAARDAGAQHIVLPSMPKVDADHPTGAYALEYPASERVLQESGVDWTVLQNAPYAENLFGRAAMAVASGELTSNAGEGRTAPVSHADCAAVAAGVLTQDGHAGKTYVVTGPQLYTQAELAELFAEATGKPIQKLELSDEEHPGRLRADGLPEPFPHLLTVHLKAVRLGYFDDLTTVVEDVTGRPPEALPGILAANRDALLGSPS